MCPLTDNTAQGYEKQGLLFPEVAEEVGAPLGADQTAKSTSDEKMKAIINKQLKVLMNVKDLRRTGENFEFQGR